MLSVDTCTESLKKSVQGSRYSYVHQVIAADSSAGCRASLSPVNLLSQLRIPASSERSSLTTPSANITIVRVLFILVQKDLDFRGQNGTSKYHGTMKPGTMVGMISLLSHLEHVCTRFKVRGLLLKSSRAKITIYIYACIDRATSTFSSRSRIPSRSCRSFRCVWCTASINRI